MHLTQLGERLRHIRDAHDLTQLELARGSGLHASQMSHWERGHYLPELVTLDKLATFYRMRLADFFLPDEDFPTVTIYRWGDRYLTLDQCRAIAQILHMSLDAFIATSETETCPQCRAYALTS